MRTALASLVATVALTIAALVATPHTISTEVWEDGSYRVTLSDGSSSTGCLPDALCKE